MESDAPDEERDAPTGAALLARLGLTLAFVVATAMLVNPFLAALTWAVALAVIFDRMHLSIEARMRPSAAAGLSVAIIALIVVAPLLLISERLFAEVMNGAGFVQDEIASGRWQRVIETHPWLRDAYVWIDQQVDLKAELQRLTTALANFGAGVVTRSTNQLFALIVSFYLLFFILRDQKRALGAVRRLSPFTIAQTDALLLRARDTINATIYGTLAVAALQGLLGGVAFWWLDIPSPALWGVIMAVLSVVPVLGSFIIWVPTALALALDNRWGDAALLAFWGAVVIGTADNLLRPLLMGEALRLHTATLFIAMIGGLSLFGASGVVIGPVIMTTTLLMLSFWRQKEPG